MLCGYLKQTCRSITVQELIDILALCKNKNAKIKLLDTNNFYIHFDQDGQFINFDIKPLVKSYGNAGANDNCEACQRYSLKEKCCKCDGKDCLNASSIVDTKKFDQLHSSNSDSSTDSTSGASTTPIQNDKYDLSKFGINGTVSENKEDNRVIEVHDGDRVYRIKDGQLYERKEESKQNNKPIQELVDDAIIKTLNKMINGIKGDN